MTILQKTTISINSSHTSAAKIPKKPKAARVKEPGKTSRAFSDLVTKKRHQLVESFSKSIRFCEYVQVSNNCLTIQQNIEYLRIKWSNSIVNE